MADDSNDDDNNNPNVPNPGSNPPRGKISHEGAPHADIEDAAQHKCTESCLSQAVAAGPPINHETAQANLGKKEN